MITFILISTFLILGCRQEADWAKNQQENKRVEEFFRNKNVNDKSANASFVSNSIQKFRNINSKTDFISKLSDQNGIPIWNYLIATKAQSNHHHNVVNKGDEEATETLIVPLRQDEHFLSSILYIKNPNSESPLIFTVTNEELLNFLQNEAINKFDRETVLMTFLYFDHQVYGDRLYSSIPSNLMNNVHLEDGENHKSFHISINDSEPQPLLEQACFTFYHCKNNVDENVCDQCTLCRSKQCYPLGGGIGDSGDTGGPTNPDNGDTGNTGGGGEVSGTNPNIPWYLYNPNINSYPVHVQNVYEKLFYHGVILQDEQLNTLRDTLGLATKFRSYISQNDTPQGASFVNWGINFFIHNPNVSWLKFEKWFIRPITQQDIISELQGYPCAQSILSQLPTMSNDISASMRNVFQNNKNYEIIFRAKTGLGIVDGETFYSYSKQFDNFRSVINLNDQILQNATKEYILNHNVSRSHSCFFRLRKI